MTRRAAPQSGVDRMVSTSWSGRRWSSPAARRGRALARGLEGRLPLQHHHVSDQNSSSSRCRASFSVALKHGIYRGLKPLEAEDAGIFFGREAPVIEALDRLRGLAEAAPPRFLVILGASGAGKSSFLRAGLLPRLSRDDRNFLPLPVIRPDRAALTGETGLVRCLDAAFQAQRAHRARAEMKAAIDGGSQTLMPLLASLAERARPPSLPDMPAPKPPALVLSIDQGEELFLAEGAEEAEKFLALLKDLSTAAAPDVIILVTIRSDSYERLQMAKALEGVKQDAMSLPPLPRGSYADVIEGPARRLKDTPRALKIEPALTLALLTDIEAGGAKDALPLLAFTLERLYVEYGGDGDLSLSEYDQLGRVEGSIEAAVERALIAADADPKIPKDRATRLALLRRGLIPWLAGIDPETGNPRRRVARFSEIPEESCPLVNLLVEQRLLATDVAKNTGEVTVEPAHEALLRQWDALQGWLKDEAAALLTLEGVRSAARDWETKKRSGDWLSHGAGWLEDAELLRRREDFARFLNPIEQAYLEACRAQENERRNRELEETRKLAEAQKKIAQRTRIGLIATSVLAVLALVKTNIALRNEAIALRNETTLLAALSTVAMDRGQSVDAVRFAVSAWPREGDDKRPQMRRVISVLSSALPQLHERMSLKGRGGSILSAAFSPDGARIVTASSDKTARIWDARTGALLKVLEGHGEIVRSAAFSPDGARVVTASKDASARIWDARTGALLKKLEGHGDGGQLRCVQPGRRARRHLLYCNDNTARIWDANTSKVLTNFEGHKDTVWSAAFSPDGARIVTTSSDKTIRIWDATTGRVLTVLEGHSGFVTAAAFSPDGARIVTACSDKTARIWDAKTGRVLKELTGHGDILWSAAFSPDGARIVTASSDKMARIWDARTGALLKVLEGHGEIVRSAAFSPDGARIVTASWDKTARIWDAGTDAVVAEFKGDGGSIASAAFSPDGARIVTASNDNTAQVWETNTGSVTKFKGRRGYFTSAAFSPDGARIVASSSDKIAWIWDARTGDVLNELEGHAGSVLSAAFSPDGARIVTASCDKTARIWDARTGTSLVKLEGHSDFVTSAAFSPDGARIVTASKDNTARIWDAQSGAPLKQLEGHGDRVTSAAFSPDGARSVTASFDKTARIWDAKTGKVIIELKGHNDTVASASFSPDGARIVTASWDKTARMWDAATGAFLGEIKGDGNRVVSATFSPDGARIVTAFSDNIARVWDISTRAKGDAFAVACAQLGNNSDLTDLAARYDLPEFKPICGDHTPNPVDWRKVPD